MVEFSTIEYHSGRLGKFVEIWSSHKFAQPPLFFQVFRHSLSEEVGFARSFGEELDRFVRSVDGLKEKKYSDLIGSTYNNYAYILYSLRKKQGIGLSTNLFEDDRISDEDKTRFGLAIFELEYSIGIARRLRIGLLRDLEDIKNTFLLVIQDPARARSNGLLDEFTRNVNQKLHKRVFPFFEGIRLVKERIR